MKKVRKKPNKVTNKEVESLLDKNEHWRFVADLMKENFTKIINRYKSCTSEEN